ncbi:hypothetical protein HPB47_001858 [Ixodes persulcatus]|uniref:Uncharacterized protein n=1 Tax=Ixodes persulcatus TaxID=34615 RepID=A0AC60PPC2_IXOPE|nr:hypothetical protein HPB47_001858 [Ixodes persulcatus]
MAGRRKAGASLTDIWIPLERHCSEPGCWVRGASDAANSPGRSCRSDLGLSWRARPAALRHDRLRIETGKIGSNRGAIKGKTRLFRCYSASVSKGVGRAFASEGGAKRVSTLALAGKTRLFRCYSASVSKGVGRAFASEGGAKRVSTLALAAGCGERCRTAKTIYENSLMPGSQQSVWVDVQTYEVSTL